MENGNRFATSLSFRAAAFVLCLLTASAFMGGCAAAPAGGMNSSPSASNPPATNPPSTNPPTTNPPASSEPNPAALNGNWKLVGTQNSTTLQASAPYLGLAIVVNGNSIFAKGYLSESCSEGYSVAGTIDATGTVNSDGSFTIKNAIPLLPILSTRLTISGHVPVGNETTWSGTYSMTDLGACIASHQGTFQATAFPALTGSYSGTLNVSGSVSTFGSQISMDVQQSTTPEGVQVGTVMEYLLPVRGTVSVAGSSCFTHGVSSSVAGSTFAAGSFAAMTFAMDDGSKLLVSGSVSDASAAKAEMTAHVQGGNCDGGVMTVMLQRQ